MDGNMTYSVLFCQNEGLNIRNWV